MTNNQQECAPQRQDEKEIEVGGYTKAPATTKESIARQWTRPRRFVAIGAVILLLPLALMLLMWLLLWKPDETTATGGATAASDATNARNKTEMQIRRPPILFLLDLPVANQDEDQDRLQLELDHPNSQTFSQNSTRCRPHMFCKSFLRYVGTTNSTRTEIALSWFDLSSLGEESYEWDFFSLDASNEQVRDDYSAVASVIGALYQQNEETLEVYAPNLNQILTLQLYVHRLDRFATTILFRDPRESAPTNATTVVWQVTCPDYQVDCVALLRSSLRVALNVQEYDSILAPTIDNKIWFLFPLRPPTLYAMLVQSYNASDDRLAGPSEAEVIAHHYDTGSSCLYFTQPCAKAFESYYYVFPDGVDCFFNWLGVERWWKEGKIHHKENNEFHERNTTFLIDDEPVPATVSFHEPSAMYAANHTNIRFADLVGGWELDCYAPEAMCVELVESSMHRFDEAAYDSLVALAPLF